MNQPQNKPRVQNFNGRACYIDEHGKPVMFVDDLEGIERPADFARVELSEVA